jgi:hypothetical protein
MRSSLLQRSIKGVIQRRNHNINIIDKNESQANPRYFRRTGIRGSLSNHEVIRDLNIYPGYLRMKAVIEAVQRKEERLLSSSSSSP